MRRKHLQGREIMTRKRRRRRKMGEVGDMLGLGCAACAMCAGFAWAWPVNSWQLLVKLVETVGVGLAGVGVPFVGRALKDGDKAAKRERAALRKIPTEVRQRALCDAIEGLIAPVRTKLEQAGIPIHYERLDRAGRLTLEIQELTSPLVVVDVELTPETEIFINVRTSTSWKSTGLEERLRDLEPAPCFAAEDRVIYAADFTESGWQVLEKYLQMLVEIVCELRGCEC